MCWKGEPGIKGYAMSEKDALFNMMNQRKGKKIKAEVIEVIKTETVEGKGIEEDPVRTMVRYWEKNGTMISENEKNSFIEEL